MAKTKSLPPMEGTALFSDCGQYRYRLTRIWDNTLKPVCFLGLNPSTADATTNDPTIRRIIQFAIDWGAGGLMMGNIFAYRTTFPNIMKQQVDPVGPRNNGYLQGMARECPIVVAAWGKDGAHMDREQQILDMFPLLHCLHVNKDGSPGHPLYLPASSAPYVYHAKGWEHKRRKQPNLWHDFELTT